MEDGQHKSQLTNRVHTTRARSHATSFAVSIAAHAAAFAALIYFAPALAKPHSGFVLAYLVEVGDGPIGRSTSAGGGAIPAIPIRSEPGPLLIPERPHSHRPIHRSVAAIRNDHELEAKRPDAKLASLAPAAAPKSAPGADSRGLESGSSSSPAGSSANASDGSGGGHGPSDAGGEGNGSSLAHADYGNNPPPVYPSTARRRDQQGTVTIRVLVGADGSVERAEIAESSGFDALDDSAVETVRRRWRFVPARRDNAPVESWVLVPIRFSLTEASASR